MADAAPLTDIREDNRAAPTFLDRHTRAIRRLGAALAGVVMIAVATWADPSDQGDRLDRVFFWCFVIFSVGLAQLFFLFVALAITGKIDLPGVFKDKHAGTGDDKTVSLSRLQAFLWTLVGLSIYFHEAATSKNGIPPIPAELLLAMGISNGVYLASKHMGQNATRDQRGGDK